MVQEIIDHSWQAVAMSEETKQFIKNSKHITRRKFIAEENVRIVLSWYRYLKGLFIPLLSLRARQP